RGDLVTGVQTCALPISALSGRLRVAPDLPVLVDLEEDLAIAARRVIGQIEQQADPEEQQPQRREQAGKMLRPDQLRRVGGLRERSEERRVGKEWRGERR